MQAPRSTTASVATVTAWVAIGVAAARAQAPDLPPPEAPTEPGDLAGAATPNAGTLFNEAFFLRLGFSFLVGLAVGFALKVAFKVAIVVVGLILLGVFGLQYAGLVDVNWTGVEAHYDTWADWLGIRGAAFLDFVGANLSSGASFLAGLALGLKL